MLDAWYSGLNRPELAEPDMRAELIENMGLFIFLSTAFNAIALVGFSEIFPCPAASTDLRYGGHRLLLVQSRMTS